MRRDEEVLITRNGTKFGRLALPEPVDEASKSRFKGLIYAKHQQIAERDFLFWKQLADAKHYHPKNVEQIELSDYEWNAFWGVIGNE